MGSSEGNINAEKDSTSLEYLGELATHVDRLSARDPLRSHPTLRSQIRRSAVDALTHAACAMEAMNRRDRERLYRRCVSALDELHTYARLAAGQEALTPHEFHGLRLRVARTQDSVHLCLEAARPATRPADRVLARTGQAGPGTTEGELEALSGVA